MIKRALVLSGGGSRGSFQVGMIRSIVEKYNINFDVIYGVSVGALNGSFIAQADKQKPDDLLYYASKLEERWKKIKNNDDIYNSRSFLSIVLKNHNSYYDNKNLYKLINKWIDVDKIKKSGTKLRIGVVSLLSGDFYNMSEDCNNLIDYIFASTCIPGVFSPQKIFNDMYVDGGIRNITPLKEAIQNETVDEIYVLLTNRIKLQENGEIDVINIPICIKDLTSKFLGTPEIIKVISRAVDIMCTEILINDINITSKKNKESIVNKKYRNVPIYIISPKKCYGNNDNGLDFSKELISEAIDHGKIVGEDKSTWNIL